MKKTFIYSFCGLFITSVAVARTLYMDVGSNTQCGGFCLVNPGDGACCPSASLVTKLNAQSSDSSTKTVEGFYLGGVKLADYDGALRTLSADEIATIRASAGTELSTGTAAQLTKQEYNKNTTQYVVFGENGEFTEYDNPQKSGTFCDHAKIILYKNDGTNASQTVYYKYGVGYFTDPARTSQFNPTSAKITRNGYTLRGWFTSTWDSSTTDKSSYIANYTPYRTIGHAFIPWANTVTAPVSSSDTLNWPGNNKAFSVTSCPDDKGTASSYPIVRLYAGWAKNCENDEYCELYISGQTPVTTLHNGYVRNTAGGTRSWKLNDKSTIYGDWLPGGVDYAWKNQGVCPSGTQYTAESTTTISLSYPYPTTTNPVTQTLNTNKLGCESTTPTQPTKIKLTYHGSAATSFDYCDIGGSNTITIKNAISSQQIEAVAYTQGGTPVFSAGQTVPCSVGNGGFATYTTDGEYYVVNLYPVAAPTTPETDTLQIKYTVMVPTNSPTTGGLTLSTMCTETQSCTKGQNVTLKSALTCSGETVTISKWTRANGTDINGFSTQCTEAALGTATYSNGVYTSTLTGTIATSTFTCPTVPSWSQYGTVTRTPGTNSCTYTLNCNEHFELFTGNTQILLNSQTITCNGNDCTDAWLSGVLLNYSCRINLPTQDEVNNELSELDDHLRVIGVGKWPDGDYDKYLYNSACTDNYTLNPPSGNSTIIAGYRTASQVANSIRTNYDCVAPAPTFTCPLKSDFAGMLPNHMLISEPTSLSGNKCKYTLSCQGSDYSLNPSSPNTVTCTESQCTEAGVLALIENTYTCQANPTFTCPDPHDLQKPNNMTISRPTLDSSTQTCTYDLGCVSGYAIPIAPPYGSSSQTISCTGDQCRDGQYLQSLIDDRQNHPLARCGKVWSTEACSATYAEGANAAGTIRTYWNPSDYNGTMCVLTGQCDELHCEPGSLGDKYCNGTIRLCGAGGGSESTTEDCLELVQNYKSVSCSNDCPSLDKMNSKLDPNIEHFSRFSYRYQTATECQYEVECESGYISNGQAVCDRTQGCKLNGAGWSFPTCSYDYGN